MLVLECRVGQSIIIKNNIEIKVLSVRGKKVQISVSLPADFNFNWEREGLRILEEGVVFSGTMEGKERSIP